MLALGEALPYNRLATMSPSTRAMTVRPSRHRGLRNGPLCPSRRPDPGNRCNSAGGPSAFGLWL